MKSLADGLPPDVARQVHPDWRKNEAAPWADCQQLQLNPAQGVPGQMSGVVGGSAATLGFLVWVCLDGNEYQCQLHADFVGAERLLGRDVLNSLDVLFRGPSGEVIVNP